MEEYTDWHGHVYKPKEESFMDKDEWELLRREVIVRDKFRCLRCDKKFRGYRPITVHHLTPRSEGGHDGLTNLVSLCDTCHDYVEINELRTKAAIIGSIDYGEDPAVKVVKKSNGPKNDRDRERPDWHKHVYGGVRRTYDGNG